MLQANPFAHPTMLATSPILTFLFVQTVPPGLQALMLQFPLSKPDCHCLAVLNDLAQISQLNYKQPHMTTVLAMHRKDLFVNILGQMSLHPQKTCHSMMFRACTLLWYSHHL
jgi:hypothetical protein